MLTRGKISNIQQKVARTGAAGNGEMNDRFVTVTFEQALELCQQYITRAATDAFRQENDAERKREITKHYIREFVDVKQPVVEGYPNLFVLKDALIDEITHYGPITKAMEDPSIDEIRANGIDQIFVETGGKAELWNQSFTDKEHMERIISKLLGVSKARLTPKIPMVNARTMEGYRVNATHSDISPYGQPAFVIRKFSKKSITPEKMMSGHSFSKNMYTLLSLIPKSDLSWITVGPTGSGKTTLNEILVREINPSSRIITIENPSEMRLIKRENDDPNGRVINDVLQYESVSEDDGEFATALRAAQTGHFFFTTLHAEGDKEAIFRFLTAYLMASNEPAELALRNICSAVKFVIFQEKLADGTRKVTSISEIIGSEGLTPIINQIYKFECEDVIEDEATHKVLKIVGHHKRVGCLSEKTQQQMLKAGIKKSRFEFLTKPPREDEVEEY